jgi:regulator of protease activity HflC (stomatin/prohibitin superfamily)
MSDIFVWVILGLFIIILLLYTFRVLREYERGVIFFLGRFQVVKGPGLIIVVPIIQQMVKVDLRTLVLVVDPERAIINVEDFFEATSQLAQTTLRSILGQHELDEMLASRDRLNTGIQKILDEQTDAWGIKVINVEIKHVDLDESMIRAIAKQAEAERERRAKVIHAQGEMEASEQLLEAASVLAKQPQALQLRYMQTLTEIAGDKSSIIVFPLPIDLIESLKAQSVPIPDSNDDTS